MSASDPTRARTGGGRRMLIGAVVLSAVVLAAFAVAVVGLSGVDVVAGDEALAQVHLGTFAGTLVGVSARGPHGTSIPVAVHDGQVTPLREVAAGTTLTVTVHAHRPGWSGWALGDDVVQRLTIRTPTAHIAARVTTLRSGAALKVAFDAPVARIAYGTPGHYHRVALRHPQRIVSLGTQAPAGTLSVAGAPRSWERLPHASAVTWFPAGSAPLAVASPAPDAQIGPVTPLRLTFSEPISALGSARPQFAKPVAGRWRERDSHTLAFVPSGTGFGLGAHVQLTLPDGVQLAAATRDATTTTTHTVSWNVPAGSTLRLHELLAQLGYLPLDWQPSGAPVGASDRAQLAAAVDPPDGSFAWRWSDLPSQLTSQWSADEQSAITRGALMAFQSDRGLTVDAIAGPSVWSALFAALREHKVNAHGYSYVLVHRDASAQTATLIHDGKTIVTTPANTGVPAAPTELGTFPVYLRYTVTTMAGTNPDGTRYNDPGIKWVSYFNGGDALHAFDRASYGTPQSVGCVEMPEAAAAKIYPYTPIGTLVQIAA